MTRISEELNLDKMSLLYDYYGGLLNERQCEVYRLYHEENYSLTEIAEEYGITKQAVSNILKKSRALLLGYEKNLGLIAKHKQYGKALSTIDEKIEKIQRLGNMQKEDKSNASNWAGDLEEIRKLISAIDY